MSDSDPGGSSAASRFVKGRSGNPKGRPKREKAKTGSAFDIVIDKPLTVTQGGSAREVTVEEALQRRTYQDAIAGSRPARREVLKMIAKREKHLTARRKPEAPRVEMVTEEDPDNAEAALLILGVAVGNSDQDGPLFKGGPLLLEPWAVQAALSRRRGGQRLSDKDRTDITRSTRDADTLRWPRRGRE